MLFLLPTDTCYGLAGNFNDQDYHDIYRLKGRDFSKLLAILVEDFVDMQNYIEISDEKIEFLRSYPHPWSFLGKRKKEFNLPDWMESDKYQMLSIRVASVCLRHREEGCVTKGSHTPECEHPTKSVRHMSGVRDPGQQKGIPHNDWIASQKGAARNDGTLNFPLFLTSANLSGHPESKTLLEAKEFFPSVEGYDGGICDRPPSDIFSIDGDGNLQYIRRNYDKTPE